MTQRRTYADHREELLRRYPSGATPGGVMVDDAFMGSGGRREATGNDIRRALALYRAAGLLLMALFGVLALLVVI